MGEVSSTPRRLTKSDLLPLSRQPHSSISDPGIAHNSYANKAQAQAVIAGLSLTVEEKYFQDLLLVSLVCL